MLTQRCPLMMPTVFAAEEDAEMKLIDFGFSRQYLEGGDKMHGQ